MAERLDVPSAVVEALKAFRGEGGDLSVRYIVLGYAAGSRNRLEVAGEGEGGLAEARAAGLFPSGECRYALFRRTLRVELVVSVKFVFVDWTPEAGLSPMVKALLSTHKGQAHDLLKPFHASLQAADDSDLTEAALESELAKASGTQHNVVDRAHAQRVTDELSAKSAAASAARLAGGAPAGALVPQSVRDVRALQIEDEAAVRAALAAVRADADATDWAAVCYADDSLQSLRLVGSGAGGLDEMAAHLAPERVNYGLFRVVERIDKSDTVKFGFVKVLCDTLAPMKKAQIATHQGFVRALFEPFHVDFSLDSRAEFTLENVMSKIQSYTGTRSAVRDTGAAADPSVAAVHAARAAGGKVTTGATGLAAPDVPRATSATLAFEDEKQFLDAVGAVHHDSSGVTWMLAAFQRKPADAMRVVAQGDDADPVAALLNAAEGVLANDDAVCFGLVRVTEVIDKSVTIKFAYVKWQPESVPPMLKARVGTLKGRIDALFEPYHVDFFITARAGLDLATVLDKVGRASGAKSNVRD